MKLGSKICTYQSDICHPCIQRGKCTWSFGSFLGEYRCHYSRKVPPHRDLYLYQIKQSFAIKTNYIYITFKQAVHAVISILYMNSEKIVGWALILILRLFLYLIYIKLCIESHAYFYWWLYMICSIDDYIWGWKCILTHIFLF